MQKNRRLYEAQPLDENFINQMIQTQPGTWGVLNYVFVSSDDRSNWLNTRTQPKQYVLVDREWDYRIFQELKDKGSIVTPIPFEF